VSRRTLFRVSGFGFRVSSGFFGRVSDFKFRVSGLFGFLRASGFGLRASGFGFRVPVFGFLRFSSVFRLSTFRSQVSGRVSVSVCVVRASGFGLIAAPKRQLLHCL